MIPPPPDADDALVAGFVGRAESPAPPAPRPRERRWARVAALLAGAAVLAGLPACGDGESERLGQSQLAIGSMGAIVQHSNDPNVDHLSTAWIPSGSVSGGLGHIVSAYTTTVDTTSSAAWAFQPGPYWYSLPGEGGPFSAHWDDPVHGPWPVPENFCELYLCPDTVFSGYISAHAILAPGNQEMAAIVAVSQAEQPTCGNFTDPCHDIVLVTSTDGGQHFTRSKIISAGAPGGLGAGAFIKPDSVYATTELTPERGAMQQYAYSAPIYVVWKASSQSAPLVYKWYATKVLVEPGTGYVTVLNPQKELPVDPTDGTVTLVVQRGREARQDPQAFEETLTDHELMSLVTTTRRDTVGTIVEDLVGCPSTQTMQIEWKYWQIRGFFAGDATNINIITNEATLASDPAWRPCVGPSHGSSAGGASPFYRNSDRAAFALHRASAKYGDGYDPVLEHIAFSMTDPEYGLSRIYQIPGSYETNGPWWQNSSETGFLPAAAGTEEYLPQVVVHQGATIVENPFDPGNFDTSSRAAPTALVRKNVDEQGAVAVIGRTFSWWWETIGFSDRWDLPYTINDASLSPTWTPVGSEGTTLGLGVFQKCVYDFYGTCDFGVMPPANPNAVTFYGTWAQAPDGGGGPAFAILGRWFEEP